MLCRCIYVHAPDRDVEDTGVVEDIRDEDASGAELRGKSEIRLHQSVVGGLEARGPSD